MRTTLVLVLGTAIALSTRPLAQRSTSSSQPSIKGVWRAVEQTINDRTIKDANLGVGFHVYTDGYFAVIRESGTPPRPPAPVENATAEQLMAAYGPFVAQFGTYQVSGDVISETTLVAKNPERAGQSGKERFKIEGNTLLLEPAEPLPGGRIVRLRLVRVESGTADNTSGSFGER